MDFHTSKCLQGCHVGGCYSKGRNEYTGRSFNLEIFKLKSGWIPVKCGTVRNVSCFYEKGVRGWVPTVSVVLQDLSGSWAVQVPAQLLSSPPDNALSWGKEGKRTRQNKAKQIQKWDWEDTSQFSSLLLPFHIGYGHSQFISTFQLPAVAAVMIPGCTSERFHHPSSNGWSSHSVAVARL